MKNPIIGKSTDRGIGNCTVFLAYCNEDCEIITGDELINTPLDERYIGTYFHNHYFNCTECFDYIPLKEINRLRKLINETIYDLENPIN